MTSRQLIIYFHLDVLVDKVEASEILTATFFPGPVYIGYCTNFSFLFSLLDLFSSFLEKAILRCLQVYKVYMIFRRLSALPLL